MISDLLWRKISFVGKHDIEQRPLCVLLRNFNQIKMVSSLYSPLPFRFVAKKHKSQQFHFTPEFGLKHEKKKKIQVSLDIPGLFI